MTLPGNAPRFGPSGNATRFYEEGNKHTAQAFRWQQPLGLTAYEYSFGRGIKLSHAKALEIGAAARDAGVALSVHAPYYINLCSVDEQVRSAGVDYILQSARLLDAMGGERLVVHVGSPQKQPRDIALARAADEMRRVRANLVAEGLGSVRLCPETMGRQSVLGSLEEVLHLVQLDDSFLPCIDFGHLHAVAGGAMRTQADFACVLDQAEDALGTSRAAQMHAHFSHIEYGHKGELKHRNFDEPGFGPDFALLAPLIKARGYALTIICESRGNMADDAAEMLRVYQNA